MISEALLQAFAMLRHFEGDVAEIAILSLRVSLTAVCMAALLGVPLGAVCKGSLADPA